jgi:pyrimidine operon attenuation protein/uracil phosphoribosyltransferase
MKEIILNHQQIEHKIIRIAYQIYETFVDEEEIILAGIASNGYKLAIEIQHRLASISDIKIHLCEVNVDKINPLGKITTSLDPDEYEGKSIVLVDDVLHSGATLIYGVKHFLDVNIKKLKTVVLVDRNHKKFPVKADFKGISLSTTAKEHVQVVFEEGNFSAYLQ